MLKYKPANANSAAINVLCNETNPIPLAAHARTGKHNAVSKQPMGTRFLNDAGLPCLLTAATFQNPF
jgi:hypothetical protein